MFAEDAFRRNLGRCLLQLVPGDEASTDLLLLGTGQFRFCPIIMQLVLW